MPLFRLHILSFWPLLVCSYLAPVHSQEVIATQGNSSSNSDCILDYTLGEVVTAFGQNSENHLTQGFQQPKLSITDVEEFSDEVNISVFPNPVDEFINIRMNSYIDGCTIHLYDLLGKELLCKPIFENTLSIPFQSYSTGNYLLVLYTKDRQKLITYKILKTQ